jgi:hypothetical protein
MSSFRRHSWRRSPDDLASIVENRKRFSMWRSGAPDHRMDPEGGPMPLRPAQDSLVSASCTENRMPQLSEPVSASEKEWQEQVKRILKGELAREGVSYRDLSDRLREIGAQDIAEANLKNKISRGTFSATFFFQCLAAIGTTALFLKPISVGNVHMPSVQDVKMPADAIEAIAGALKKPKS